MKTFNWKNISNSKEVVKLFKKREEIEEKIQSIDKASLIKYEYEKLGLDTDNSRDTLLWLDDLRNPYLNEEKRLPLGCEDYDIHWVLSYDQFVSWILKYGLPKIISFDHDLSEEHYTPEFFWNDYESSKAFQLWKKPLYKNKTGEDCATWLLNYCNSRNKELPKINIHSANPVGCDFIKEVLSIPLTNSKPTPNDSILGIKINKSKATSKINLNDTVFNKGSNLNKY